MFGKWRITEIRGQGWTWDVNRWKMKYANDSIKVSKDSIRGFAMPTPVDVQGVGFDLFPVGKALVYYQKDLPVNRLWRYNKALNELRVTISQHQNRAIKPFIEDGMLKLAIGENSQMILERIY